MKYPSNTDIADTNNLNRNTHCTDVDEALVNKSKNNTRFNYIVINSHTMEQWELNRLLGIIAPYIKGSIQKIIGAYDDNTIRFTTKPDNNIYMYITSTIKENLGYNTDVTTIY